MPVPSAIPAPLPASDPVPVSLACRASCTAYGQRCTLAIEPGACGSCGGSSSGGARGRCPCAGARPPTRFVLRTATGGVFAGATPTAPLAQLALHLGQPAVVNGLEVRAGAPHECWPAAGACLPDLHRLVLSSCSRQAGPPAGEVASQLPPASAATYSRARPPRCLPPPRPLACWPHRCSRHYGAPPSPQGCRWISLWHSRVCSGLPCRPGLSSRSSSHGSQRERARRYRCGRYRRCRRSLSCISAGTSAAPTRPPSAPRHWLPLPRPLRRRRAAAGRRRRRPAAPLALCSPERHRLPSPTPARSLLCRRPRPQLQQR